jgi:hypothetical protein
MLIVFGLILTYTSCRWEPALWQRFEFGAPGARGSGWATDWPKAVLGLNELAHAAGPPLQRRVSLRFLLPQEKQKGKGTAVTK